MLVEEDQQVVYVKLTGVLPMQPRFTRHAGGRVAALPDF